MKYMRSCKEVAALVIAREDRSLGVFEDAQLRFHMLICKACPNFARQVLTMRNALRQWRHYEDVALVDASAEVTQPASAAK